MCVIVFYCSTVTQYKPTLCDVCYCIVLYFSTLSLSTNPFYVIVLM